MKYLELVFAPMYTTEEHKLKLPTFIQQETQKISAIIIERHVLENEEDGLRLRKINQLNMKTIKIKKLFCSNHYKISLTYVMLI